MRGKIIALIVLLLWAAPSTLHAAVGNGGFETGNLSLWTLTGQGFAQTSVSGVTPTSGTYEAELDTTGNFTALPPALVPALGVPGASILALGQGSPVTGTCITQSVTASAGDLLSFDWNFASDELNESATFNDFAIYTIDSSCFLLASRNTSTWDISSPPPGYDGQTNWATQTYTFTTPGPHTLGFAVFNVGDAGHNSAMFLDGVSVPGVPEPTAIAFAPLLLATLVLKRRRKRSTPSI
jgi:hypothetical protein